MGQETKVHTALAHFLATRNVRVTLLEIQTDFAREFRGEALLPSGIEVLDQLQMDDVLEKSSHPTVLQELISGSMPASKKETRRLQDEDDADTMIEPNQVIHVAQRKTY